MEHVGRRSAERDAYWRCAIVVGSVGTQPQFLVLSTRTVGVKRRRHEYGSWSVVHCSRVPFSIGDHCMYMSTPARARITVVWGRHCYPNSAIWMMFADRNEKQNAGTNKRNNNKKKKNPHAREYYETRRGSLTQREPQSCLVSRLDGRGKQSVRCRPKLRREEGGRRKHAGPSQSSGRDQNSRQRASSEWRLDTKNDLLLPAGEGREDVRARRALHAGVDAHKVPPNKLCLERETKGEEKEKKLARTCGNAREAQRLHQFPRARSSI